MQILNDKAKQCLILQSAKPNQIGFLIMVDNNTIIDDKKFHAFFEEFEFFTRKIVVEKFPSFKGKQSVSQITIRKKLSDGWKL